MPEMPEKFILVNVMPEAILMLDTRVLPEAVAILEILRHLGPDRNPIMDIGDRNNPQRSHRQRRIKEILYPNSILIIEATRLEGRPGEDFDTWWISVEVYIHNQQEKFPKDDRTIDRIGFLMDKYNAVWNE